MKFRIMLQTGEHDSVYNNFSGLAWPLSSVTPNSMYSKNVRS